MCQSGLKPVMATGRRIISRGLDSLESATASPPLCFRMFDSLQENPVVHRRAFPTFSDQMTAGPGMNPGRTIWRDLGPSNAYHLL